MIPAWRTAVALGVALAFAGTAVVAQLRLEERRSGYADMGPALRAMQDDDAANPAMLWVLEGAALWARVAGAAGKSCADCHGAPESMTGVAARHPAFDAAMGRPVTLEQRVNACRVERQQAPALAPESRESLALTALIAKQSRGAPLAPPDDPRLEPSAASGAALFERRQGQLNLSCAICHDDNHGRKLGAATIPQGHPTAYPLYRLEWQGVGSLARRLRNCMIGMRAEPYAYGSPEYVDLELFLARRARGMPSEAPGVRP
ncbi:MAG: sulfur oxidation c-type cytochrome SoxA [Rhodospirillales bacterium]|nr:MAG: sulfur oxidation c-type cytochrome SoxA [Rhodospirillales bacterium]